MLLLLELLGLGVGFHDITTGSHPAPTGSVSAQSLHTHHRLQNTHSMESDQSDVSKKGRKPRRSGLELLATEPADSPLPRRGRNTASPIPPPSSSPSPSPIFQRKADKFLPGSSSRRPSYYLLGSAPLSLSDNKLPKIKAVLARILAQSDADTGKHRVEDAIQKVIVEIKDIWTLHFHPQWIWSHRHSSGDRDTETIISRDCYIASLLHDIYKEWLLLESDSRRPIRNNKKWFLEKEKNFEEKIDLPLDIRKRDYEQIMRTSGILEWKEDFAYLNAQMTKEQPGHLGSVDERQLRKDQHKEQQRLKEAARLEKEERDRLEEDERKRSFYKETTRETEEVEALDVNENDLTYEERKTKKKKKIDVMGAIAQCSDARHLSVRDKTFVAASVSNAFGIGIEETNISKTTAWRRGCEERVKKAAEIKDNFSCPNKVCVHWDGKTLQKKGQNQI